MMAIPATTKTSATISVTDNNKFLVSLSVVDQTLPHDDVARYTDQVHAFDDIGQACAFLVSKFNG